MPNIDYEQNQADFFNYIENCRKKIINSFFSKEELDRSNHIRINLLNKNAIDPATSIEDSIKIHRNNLIRIKIDHTMRIVEDVTKISQKIGANVDFEKAVKVSALLHDIGRFDQAIYDNDYNDRTSRLFNPDKNETHTVFHGDYGYERLVNMGGFDEFHVPREYQAAIANVVKHHQDATLKGELNRKFKTVNELNLESILTGNYVMNEQEQIITSALVQMVKDVDMLDILHQFLTGDVAVVNPTVQRKVGNKKIEDFCKEFGVTAKDLMEYNGLENGNLDGLAFIKIPTDKIKDKKVLDVPEDIKERFFRNEDMDLQELISRNDWTFVVGVWWKLNHFLNNINFVSNLEVVEESNLLDDIYKLYPEEYKPLVFPAFEFAHDRLLRESIKLNEGNIYVEQKIR